jgi:hypothetical protein
MPATSEKQKKFMDAVAHNKGFAKKAGVPQSVGKDFSEASKGMKFGSGSGTRADRQVVNQPKTDHGAAALFKKGGSMASKMNPGFMAMMAKKKDAKPSAMGKPTMKPGMSTAKDGMKKPTPMAKPAMPGSMMGMKKGGAPVKKMAAGGLSGGHKAADGVASKGKTKGMQVSMSGNKGMKSGGMSKKYC